MEKNFFLKKFFQKLWKLWMAFANVLGTINSFILLTLIFFLFMGPYGLLLRLFGKNFADRKFVDRPTYWIKKEPTAHSIDAYKRQF